MEEQKKVDSPLPGAQLSSVSWGQLRNIKQGRFGAASHQEKTDDIAPINPCPRSMTANAHKPKIVALTLCMWKISGLAKDAQTTNAKRSPSPPNRPVAAQPTSTHTSACHVVNNEKHLCIDDAPLCGLHLGPEPHSGTNKRHEGPIRRQEVLRRMLRKLLPRGSARHLIEVRPLPRIFN